MLTKEQQKELLGVGLLALALFVGLALLPVAVFGESGPRWFPSGNTMGVVGGVVAGALIAGLGAAAVCVPVLLALGGLRAAAWWEDLPTVRVGIFVLGLLFLLPAAVYVAGGGPPNHGALGRWTGEPLVAAFGWLGAGLVLGAGFALLSVGTLAWNPLRAAASALGRGGTLLGRMLRWLAALASRLKERIGDAFARGVSDATPVPREEPRVVEQASAVPPESAEPVEGIRVAAVAERPRHA
ncbi:MAG: DNA translocase FtsK 4TM domain-containing protein, partial [Gemmatimonadetes bacterium]|nr:DNA translocase FtsK 4TM domain-containing protein [Gemmatimonadota bacterium]